MVRIDVADRPPELGWEPFLEWLCDHDLDPDWVRWVEVEGNEGTVGLMVDDGHGGRQIKGDEVVVHEQGFTVHRPLPRCHTP